MTPLSALSAWAGALERLADTRAGIGVGLVVEVPGQKRSAGDGTLYAALPLLKLID